MQTRILLAIVRCLPRRVMSRLWGGLARWRRPKFFVSWLKRTFVRANGLDMSEAELPIEAYPTLDELFVRRLKDGARPVDSTPDGVACPCDGTAGARGLVEAGMLFQIKGKAYSLAELLGTSDVSRFEGGAFATLYLAPYNYHRVHAPLSGDVTGATVLPGTLFPVFREAVRRVDRLFARNERIVTWLDCGDAGRVACVMVGAMMVGRMTVSFDDLVTNGWGRRRMRALSYDPPRHLDKGGELGIFHLGSTVVLVAEPDRISWALPEAGQPVRMGQRIGSIDSSSSR